MNDEERHDRENLRGMVFEEQMVQMKRTIKSLIYLTVLYFAVRGASVVYHFFIK